MTRKSEVQKQLEVATRDHILQFLKGEKKAVFKREEADIPEFGQKIFLRELSAFQAGLIRKMSATDVDQTQVQGKILAMAMVDEDGHQLVDPNSEEEVGQLVQVLGQHTLARLLTQLTDMNQVDKDGLEKNSPTPPDSVSSSR